MGFSKGPLFYYLSLASGIEDSGGHEKRDETYIYDDTCYNDTRHWKEKHKPKETNSSDSSTLLEEESPYSALITSVFSLLQY